MITIHECNLEICEICTLECYEEEQILASAMLTYKQLNEYAVSRLNCTESLKHANNKSLLCHNKLKVQLRMTKTSSH